MYAYEIEATIACRHDSARRCTIYPTERA